MALYFQNKLLNRNTELKNASEVYFDNQIGIVEIIPKDSEPKKTTKVA